jgi:hypothetical protein
VSTRAKKTATRKQARQQRRFLAAIALMKNPEILTRPWFAPGEVVVIDRAAFRTPPLGELLVPLAPLRP